MFELWAVFRVWVLVLVGEVDLDSILIIKCVLLKEGVDLNNFGENMKGLKTFSVYFIRLLQKDLIR